MITIQPASIFDYTDIVALHASNWKQTYRGMLSDNYLDHEVEKDWLNVWYKRFT